MAAGLVEKMVQSLGDKLEAVEAGAALTMSVSAETTESTDDMTNENNAESWSTPKNVSFGTPKNNDDVKVQIHPTAVTAVTCDDPSIRDLESAVAKVPKTGQTPPPMKRAKNNIAKSMS